MSAIDNAIAKLQDHALACTGIRGAPDYPVDDAGVLPLAIAHLANGTFSADDATANRGLYVINADFHFNRMSLKDAYTRIDTLVPEYKQKLCADPTLGGAVFPSDASRCAPGC